MHKENINFWQHKHLFNTDKSKVEKKTFIVVVITILTMFAEIFSGWLFNSMALLADGWHMGTHAAALIISLTAYILARRFSLDRKYTFGTWKIEILGAYTSSIILGIVGLYVSYISIERIFKPLPINYNSALTVALIGLIVNIACAFVLSDTQNEHHHDHTRENNSPHNHSHTTDLNLRSAYLHVIADAMTSVMAIIAISGAKYLRWNFLDPSMGILGSLLILRWSFLLLTETSSILLDKRANTNLQEKIKEAIEKDGDSRISDLHLWLVGQNRYACIVSLVAKNCYSIEEYKSRLIGFNEISHVTFEIQTCKDT